MCPRWFEATQAVKDVAMSRRYAKITVEELKAKIAKVCGDEGIRPLLEHLGKDIKVKFDTENFTDSGDFRLKPLLGYRSDPSGLTYYGAAAGGDWEHPVYCVVYWDGKRLRGYVPTDGNPWNTDTKEAYGNDEAADLKNARKRWPEVFKDADEVEPCDFRFDAELIKADFLSRVTSLQPDVSGKAKATPPTVANGETLRRRVESSVYYGTGDEGIELFQQLCGTCYMLCGLGHDDRAAIVAGWIEDDAEASRQDAIENDYTDDFRRGSWGYN